MASIAFIEKRVEGKEKEMTKLMKKLVRIEKAKESGWEKNPYCYNERDLIYTQRDIADCEEALNKYKAQLKEAKEKAASRDVQIIIDFLNEWKEANIEAYRNAVPKYLNAYKEFKVISNEYTEWFNTKRMKEDVETRRKISDEFHKKSNAFNNKWAWLTEYMDACWRTMDVKDMLDEEKLMRDLTNEANRKYDFIIERTNKICGQITDASNLYINAGELNGYIIGSRGNAKVQTVGAGGYNIQRFHFRTLIHEMK